MKKYIPIFAITLFLTLAPSALAHEVRTYQIGGNEYTFTVGSLGEPVVVDDKSGVDFGLKKNGVDFVGAEKVLKVEVGSGSVKKVFNLDTVWGAVGKYKTTFYLTKTDPVSYRFFGKVDGNDVDFLFQCSAKGHQMNAVEDKTVVKISDTISLVSNKGSFGCPAEKSAYQFPVSTSDQYHSDKFILLAIIIGVLGIILSIWFK